MKKSLLFLIVSLNILVLFGCNQTKHEHTVEWHYDEVSHWDIFTCGCEQTGFTTQHTFDEGKVEKNAALMNEIVYTCTTCGYMKDEVTINYLKLLKDDKKQDLLEIKESIYLI